MKKLMYEIKKNFSLLFRNWSVLILLILAPLILILGVGYAYSGEGLHDINIGLVNINQSDSQKFLSNLTDFAKLSYYGTNDSCFDDIKTQKVHLCLVFGKNFSFNNAEGIPGGEISFYYDNSRKKTLLVVIKSVADYFGVASEEISILTAQNLLGKIQGLVVFINERGKDVDNLKLEAQNIRAELVERGKSLKDLRDSFLPKYYLIKSIQAEFNQYSSDFFTSTEDLNENALQMKRAMNQSRTSLSDIDSFFVNDSKAYFSVLELAGYNTTIISSALDRLYNNSFKGNKSALLQAFDELDYSLNSVLTDTQNVRSNILRINDSFNNLVMDLDSIKIMLDEEIKRNDEFIVLIDKSVAKIDELSTTLNEKLEDLNEVEPSLASKIVKPITLAYNAALPSLTNVQAAYPLLLSTVIIFISILFSNIVTILEINNRAFLRNIIAPVNDLYYTSGLILTNFIVIFFQVIVLFLVAQYRFHVDILNNLFPVMTYSVILVLIFILIGMTVAYLTKNSQSSILLATFIGMAFFLFSDAVNALEMMPKPAAFLASYNPIVIVNAALNKHLLFGLHGSMINQGFYVLLGYLIISLAALVYFSKRKNKQRL